VKELKFSLQKFEESLRESGVMVELPKKVRMASSWAIAPQTPVTAYIFNFKIDLDSPEDKK
jgi:hypothetical protein